MHCPCQCMPSFPSQRTLLAHCPPGLQGPHHIWAGRGCNLGRFSVAWLMGVQAVRWTLILEPARLKGR